MGDRANIDEPHLPGRQESWSLAPTVVLLAVLAVFGSLTLGYVSYLSSRNSALQNLYQSRLKLARTLAADYGLEVSVDNRQREEALVRLGRLWTASERRFAGSYLCVIGPDGRQLLDTEEECRVGAYVGDTRLEAREGEPQTLAQLLAGREDWAGQTRDGEGRERVSAYAYSEPLGGLVAVHVPTEEVLGEINATVLPWAVGLGLMTLLGFSATLGVLHRSHRRAEAALRQARERYRVVVETAMDGIVQIDEGSRILFVNPGAERIFGYRAAELLGQELTVLMPDYLRKLHKSAVASYLKTGEKHISWRGTELTGLHKSGQEISIELSLGEHLDNGRRFFTGTLRDVGERRRLEERLWLSQKLESIGLLAGGIAHDFNNSLMVIRGYSELLLERVPAEVGYRHLVDEIGRAAERAAAITRQLLAFGRRQVMQPAVLNLNQVVAETDSMLRRLIGEHIELVSRLDPELGRVKVDPGQMEQVIVNLVVNARDAMPQGGKLTLETRNVEVDESYSRKHMAQPPGPYVMLAVSDTGVGMDKQTQARIFEPFFTTKEQGRGTGLGLATVYGIVKQSGGWIWVYSERDHGTTFKIYLPLVEESTPARPATQAARPAAVPEGTRTVLLVEDEEALRSLVREFLESLGYSVLEAEGGAQAVALAKRHVGPLHVLITDVVMPGLSGRALAEQVRVARPEIKVLYVSGYPDDAIVHHGVLEPGMHFLQKPFTIDLLARKLQVVLGTADPGLT